MEQEIRRWSDCDLAPEYVAMVRRIAHLVDRIWALSVVPANRKLINLLGQLVQLLGEMLIEASEPKGVKERRRLQKKLRELERETKIAVLLYG
jgi:hypothetical protein